MPSRARRAFTLVEMLVATALILFIMVILTEAFVAGLESFRQLKAIGDLQEKMRTVAVILRRDLSAPHFDDNKSLSQQDLSADQATWQPPPKGFFRIWQGSPLTTGGTGAAGVATMSGTTVTGVAITSGGSGYLTPPSVSFFGGGGTGAAGTATVSPTGQVTLVTMSSGGSGYTSAPAVIIGGNYASEPGDPDGIESNRAVDHILHFTINLTLPPTTGRSQSGYDPNRLEAFLTANVPPGNPPGLDGMATGSPVTSTDADFRSLGTYSAQWAEVAYYLRRAPGNPTANGTPLYGLYRRQSLAFSATDAAALNTGVGRVSFPAPSNGTAAPEPGAIPAGTSHFGELSCKQDLSAPTFLFFNSPDELTIPERRFGTQNASASAGLPIELKDAAVNWIIPISYPVLSDQLPAAAAQTGDDLLLTDVISFEVKVLTPTSGAPAGTGFVNLYDATLPGSTNTKYDNLVGPMVFDTWSQRVDTGVYDYSGWFPTSGPTATTVPLRIKVLAVQITLRVWDARTQQTRQLSIVQDM